MTALDGNHAQSRFHVGVCHRYDAAGEFHRRRGFSFTALPHPALRAEKRVNTFPRGPLVETKLASEEVLRVQAPEHEMSIRHSGLRSATAVAGRTGHGSGALRPD